MYCTIIPYGQPRYLPYILPFIQPHIFRITIPHTHSIQFLLTFYFFTKLDSWRQGTFCIHGGSQRFPSYYHPIPSPFIPPFRISSLSIISVGTNTCRTPLSYPLARLSYTFTTPPAHTTSASKISTPVSSMISTSPKLSPNYTHTCVLPILFPLPFI